MYKSCSYCGKIHDVSYECPSKPKKKQIDKDNDTSVAIRKFRSSMAWTNKAKEIQQRDLKLCQVCLRKLYNTVNQYTFINTSVHHIFPLSIHWDKRLDNGNLITLCSMHHQYADDGYIPVDVLRKIVEEQEHKVSPPT